ISDIISVFSLETILIKNRSLIFFTALILFMLLLKLKLDYSAAISGFGLFYFNFLAIINANSFTTTSSNIFFFLSSLFAIVCFHIEKKDIKSNIIWVLSAMFLMLTSRYELFVVSFMGFLTVSGIYIKEYKIRFNIAREHPLFSAGIIAYFGVCLLWLARLVNSIPYNGPDIGDAVNLLGNLKYQLIEHNAAFFVPQASLIVPLVVVLSFFVILYRGLEDREKLAKNLIIGTFIMFWIIYFSIIFAPLDLYPLHFIRHRLYFFIPFVILFAFAWDSAVYFLKHMKFIRFLKPIMAVLLILAYAFTNIRTVESLQNEKRTNDIELEFLSKAQKKISDKYIVVYPAFDHRFFLLKKYFPFYDDCAIIEDKRYVKYVSAKKFIMRKKGDIIQNYHPLKSNYIGKEEKAAFKIFFDHRFYTMWPDLETRDEIPIEMGFYFADGSKDEAWILNSQGQCEFRAGNFNKALKYFKTAVKIDADCLVCAYNASATYAFLGKEKDALLAIKRSIESCDSYGVPAFEKAFIYMASHENKKAKRFLENFLREDMEKNNHQNEVLLSMASIYLDELSKRLLSEESLK
ncbi:MAG: tetratricopeptide repeat protein, partial [Elusimicrobiota bacterium]|nr:tetratricopeptide repeat protein [Elusimicrobiota bacterium]